MDTKYSDAVGGIIAIIVLLVVVSFLSMLLARLRSIFKPDASVRSPTGALSLVEMKPPEPDVIEDIDDIARRELDSALDAEQMKLVVAQWKLERSEYRRRRTVFAKEMRAVRADYTHEVRQRGPMARGGGGFGAFIRLVQGNSRAGRRAKLTDDLAPHEGQLRALDNTIADFDRITIMGERRLLELKAAIRKA